MDYLFHLIIIFAVYSILGLSLNLLVGYAGLLSVAHAAFYGIGAYTTAIILTKTSMGFFTSIVVGVTITIIVGLLIGVVLSKFKGDYYALVTLSFNTIIFSIFLNWQTLTGGPLGIAGVPKPELFGISFDTTSNFLILTLVIFVLVFLISRYIANSPFGRALKAIREDETALAVFGYNTFKFKLVIFVITAALASIAGSLFAAYITFIDPSSFQILESTIILAIIIIGGLANLWGSIFGALFFILLPEALRFIGLPPHIAAQMRQVIYGVILILLTLYRPQGLRGEYKL